MKHLYLYVPQCRRCGSWNTGVYMSGLLTHEWLIQIALKRGIYILIIPPSYNASFSQPNCFCGACGISWREDDVRWRLLSQDEFDEQIKLRNINTAIDNSQTFFCEAKERKKQEIRNNKWYRKLGRKIKSIKEREGLF